MQANRAAVSLLRRWADAAEDANPAKNTASVIREVRVKLGPNVFKVRQQWLVSATNTKRPKIRKAFVMKID